MCAGSDASNVQPKKINASLVILQTLWDSISFQTTVNSTTKANDFSFLVGTNKGSRMVLASGIVVNKRWGRVSPGWQIDKAGKHQIKASNALGQLIPTQTPPCFFPIFFFFFGICFPFGLLAIWTPILLSSIVSINLEVQYVKLQYCT